MRTNFPALTILLAALFVMAGDAANAFVNLTLPDELKNHKELREYLIVGTRSSDIGHAVNLSNNEVGANQHVFSRGSLTNGERHFEINGSPVYDGDPNTQSTPGDNNGWIEADNIGSATGGRADYHPNALPVYEGIDFKGNIAITHPNGKFVTSNTEVNATLGVRCAADTQDCMDGDTGPDDWGLSSVNAWFSGPQHTNPGIVLGDGTKFGSDHPRLDTDGVFQVDLTPLTLEIEAWRHWIEGDPNSFGDGLKTDLTLYADTDDLTDLSYGKGNAPKFINLDAEDGNNDGIVVIDIQARNGDGTFKIENSDLILDTNMGKLAIFRLLGGTILDMSNGTILMGSDPEADPNWDDSPWNDPPNPNSDTDPWQEPVDELGAIFFHGASNGNTGQNEVFNFDNVALNGIAFWDLDTDPATKIQINNGQGCVQFLASEVNIQNGRWTRCSFPSNGTTAPGPSPAPSPGTLTLLVFGALFLRQFVGRT